MLEELFSAIDIFGIPILLNFSKSKKARSSFGGFCSVLFFGFVLWSIYNSGYELFAREQPQIIDGTTYSEDARPVEISSKSLPLAFAIRIDDEIMDKKFCKYVYYLEGGVNQTLSLETCTEQHLNITSDLIDTAYNISDYKCFPIKPVFTTATRFSVLAFCPWQEGIEDEFFAQTPEAVLIFPVNGLTLRDYDNPIKLYADDDSMPLVANTSILNTWSLAHLSITTDDGWLTAAKDVKEYIQMTNQQNRNYRDVDMPGVEYKFIVSQQENSYQRTYKRIQNVLAEVGGIANAVFTVLLVLIFPYARIKFSEAFVNELFDIERKKSKKKSAKKASKVQKEGPENANSSKFNSNTPSPKHKKSHEIEIQKIQKMQNPNKKQAIQSKDASLSEKESKYHLFVNSKVNENFHKSPRQSENDGLLSPHRDEESNIQLEPKMTVKTFRSARLSFQKAYTQPCQPENSPRNKSTERKEKFNKKKGASSAVELDDFLYQFDSPNNSMSPEKSLADDQEKIKSSGNQQNNFEVSEYCSIKVKSERKEELLKVHDVPSQDPSVIEVDKNSPQDNTNKLLNKPDTYKVTQKKSSKPKKIKKVKSINISIFEYVWSFVSKSESLKEKMTILNIGLKTVDDRLDILSLLKKMRDIDKMKGLLFDQDQLFLFDHTQRPEIMSRETHWYREEYLPYDQIFDGMEDQIINSRLNIQDKPEKSQIDQKLLDIFPN